MGKIARVVTTGHSGLQQDPPKTESLESRLQHLIWVYDVAMGCDYIGPHVSILETIADVSGGLPLVTWTVRTAEELAHARKHGAAPIFEGMNAALAMSPGTPI